MRLPHNNDTCRMSFDARESNTNLCRRFRREFCTVSKRREELQARHQCGTREQMLLLLDRTRPILRSRKTKHGSRGNSPGLQSSLGAGLYVASARTTLEVMWDLQGSTIIVLPVRDRDIGGRGKWNIEKFPPILPTDPAVS